MIGTTSGCSSLHWFHTSTPCSRISRCSWFAMFFTSLFVSVIISISVNHSKCHHKDLLTMWTAGKDWYSPVRCSYCVKNHTNKELSLAKKPLGEHCDKNTLNKESSYSLKRSHPNLWCIGCEQFIENTPMKCSNAFKKCLKQ